MPLPLRSFWNLPPDTGPQPPARLFPSAATTWILSVFMLLSLKLPNTVASQPDARQQSAAGSHSALPSDARPRGNVRTSRTQVKSLRRVISENWAAGGDDDNSPQLWSLPPLSTEASASRPLPAAPAQADAGSRRRTGGRRAAHAHALCTRPGSARMFRLRSRCGQAPETAPDVTRGREPCSRPPGPRGLPGGCSRTWMMSSCGSLVSNSSSPSTAQDLAKITRHFTVTALSSRLIRRSPPPSLLAPGQVEERGRDPARAGPIRGPLPFRAGPEFPERRASSSCAGPSEVWVWTHHLAGGGGATPR